MLCQTCPIRSQCTSPCEELNKDLAKQEVYLRETSIDPEQAKHILEEWQKENPDEVFFEEQICSKPWDEYIPKLRDALLSLSHTEKLCIYLHYWEGYSIRDIAKYVKKSKTSVARSINHAQVSLKKYLCNQFRKSKPFNAQENIDLTN